MKALAHLPDDTRVALIIGSGDLTVGELRAALVAGGPVVVTTAQASERWSRSPEWWAERAAAGDIPGAVKDGGGWRLPVEACEEYLASLSARKKERIGVPWSQRASAQAARTGSPTRKAG